MYKHIFKCKKMIEEKGIKFTILKCEKDFNYYFLEHNPNRKNMIEFKNKYGDNAKGYSWADSRSRWCSTLLKTQVINKYISELSKTYNVIQFIGLAYDEQNRINNKNAKMGNKRFPLNTWKWTEKDCLEYCYSLGFDWGGLYNYFDRVSCWCCPLQSLNDLRNLYKHFPELWEELKEMDNNTWRQFRTDYSIEELEKRFKFEAQRLQANKSIKNREFFNELKIILNKES